MRIHFWFLLFCLVAAAGCKRDPVLETFKQGYQLNDMGRLEEAKEAFKKVISTNPYEVYAYVEIGNIYKKQGRYNLAMEQYNQALQLSSVDSAYLGRAQIYEKFHQFDKATLDYTRLISVMPFFAQGYASRGFAYAQMGELQKAVKDFDIALKLDPKDGKTFYNRAFTHYLRGSYKLSYQDILKAQKTGFAVPADFYKTITDLN